MHSDAYSILTDKDLFTEAGVPKFGDMLTAIEHYALQYRSKNGDTATKLGDRVEANHLSEEIVLPIFGTDYINTVRTPEVADALLTVWGPAIGDYVLFEDKLYVLTNQIDIDTAMQNGFKWVPTLDQLFTAGGLEDRADLNSLIIRTGSKYMCSGVEVTDLHDRMIKKVVEVLTLDETEE